MRNRKSTFINHTKNFSMMANIFNQVKLVWLLFQDSRVSLLAKLVLPLSFLYLISPIDFVPDFLLGLGQLDDLSVILLGMALFVKLSPPHVVEYYRHQLEYGGYEDYDDKDETVDTTYR